MVNGGGVDTPLSDGHYAALRGGHDECLRIVADYDGDGSMPETFVTAANVR